ncbi:hypothetical protein [Aphanothece sacrum]|uniref:Uncharacterized protein n=1 Tax=Aphanothece sacrum FPU1 TaxID=1920663 RepID=A0A401IDY8_APHSA|nr:hypothetical protein [Aphanothece sacrum]GBF79492.1 hypothetical protein AsFPU1_0888 [Aphanothece sacrum FPU1]GBF83967.1 hypothetical protein AsFPU3_1011 [Aphanothece sacrum FPU3]
MQEYLQKELSLTKITYQNKPLALEEVYQDMIEEIIHDKDINNNKNNVLKRIEKFLSVPIPDINSLLNECQKLNNNSDINPQQKRQLIEVILKIVKAKDYWKKKITVEDDYLPQDKAKDNVMRTIANFYANSCDLSDKINSTIYHIPQWVNFLYSIHSNTF